MVTLMAELSFLYPLAIGVPLLILTVVLILRFRRWRRVRSESAFEYPDAVPPGGYDDGDDPDRENDDAGRLDRLMRYLYPYRRR